MWVYHITLSRHVDLLLLVVSLACREFLPVKAISYRINKPKMLIYIANHLYVVLKSTYSIWFLLSV